MGAAPISPGMQDDVADEMPDLIPLATRFDDRAALAEHVASLSNLTPPAEPSPIIGGRAAALSLLAAINPAQYSATRNHLDGAVTRLSAYIRHGVLTLDEVRNHALDAVATPKQAEKFIQELAWRDYWQRLYIASPDAIWVDVEAYKTGFVASDYADDLPADIARGATGVACIDAFITTLLETGYLHNHARMYVAAYVVHWRQIKWQTGARWFLQNLIDGDPASNNLSWQWIASTFANKPYFFNLENVARYAGPDINVSAADNLPLAHSYERLAELLFPNLPSAAAS